MLFIRIITSVVKFSGKQNGITWEILPKLGMEYYLPFCFLASMELIFLISSEVTIVPGCYKASYTDLLEPVDVIYCARWYVSFLFDLQGFFFTLALNYYFELKENVFYDC